MANTFNLGNGNWAQKTEKLLAYNAENDNYKPLPFDFDRASTATRVNRDGLIETVGVDEPRIDFLNNSKGHLLLEPSRRNKFLYSEDLTQFDLSSSGTGAANPTITSNYAISPDGTQNADRVQFNAGTDSVGTSRVTDSFTIFATEETISVYLKSNDEQEYVIDIIQSNQAYDTVTVTSEWQRFSFTRTNVSPDLYGIGLTNINGGQTADILAWGFQLETGSYATSYIPTSGQSGGVTRSAETCNNAGNDSIFSEAEGVLYVESEALANDETSRVIASISDGTYANRIVLQYTNNVGGNQVIAFIQTPSGYSSVLTRSITNALVFNKFAIVYSDITNNFDLWVNGTRLGDGVFVHSFQNTLNTIQLADANGTGNPFYGKIKDVRVYNTALSDSELQALTS